MTDETQNSRPKVYLVPIDQESANLISELMPAACKWALEDSLPPPDPRSLVGMAIAYFHEQVFSQAREIVRKEQGKAAQATDDAIARAMRCTPRHH